MKEEDKKWLLEQLDEAQRLVIRLRGAVITERMTGSLNEARIVAEDLHDVTTRITAELQAMAATPI